MRRLSDSISRLQALRKVAPSVGDRGRLQVLGDFGPNPGALEAKCYVPATIPSQAPLVVVLHGCTQTAAGYDEGSGWSELADRHGFALLYPEQSRRNNVAGCFNWFDPADIRRGGGEAMSIHQMIETMIERHDIDPRRIYVTGLSAGGAMAMAMLAAYPELFAGGGIIAGLPYGCASSVPEALDRMRGHDLPTPAALAAKVRKASDYTGPWPSLSVWQGSGDRTVDPINAEAILSQWRGLEGLPEAPLTDVTIDGARRRAWVDASGRDVLEAWTIPGMGHGTPLETGPGGVGMAGPFMLDVGISSTQHLAALWGLAPAVEVSASSPRQVRPAAAAPSASRQPGGLPAGEGGVGRVIEDALRAAGLLR